MQNRYYRPSALIGHVVVLAAALTCLRLGWWQWEVFHEAGGTGQNLGYSLLWPVFSASFIYMWLRFLHLESTSEQQRGAEAADNVIIEKPAVSTSQEASDSPPASAVSETTSSQIVGVGYVDIDDEDDPELAAYNRALAQLAEQDERRAR